MHFDKQKPFAAASVNKICPFESGAISPTKSSLGSQELCLLQLSSSFSSEVQSFDQIFYAKLQQCYLAIQNIIFRLRSEKTLKSVSVDFEGAQHFHTKYTS